MDRPGSSAAGRRGVVHIALGLDAETRRAMEQRLAERGFAGRFIQREAELVECLPECEWLLVGRPPRIDWTSAERLRLLQVPGTGVDPLFPALGLRDSVRIACARGAQADAVRDHAMALLLALACDIPRLCDAQSRRQWSPSPRPSLTGRVVTVVGHGAVGRRVVETARAFGLRVRVVCRTPRAISDVESVVSPDGLSEALSGADFVVVCVPLTDATRGLLDERALGHLPPHAALIDVSRGGIVDPNALEAALRNGRLRTAALDVFEKEPLPPTHSLWSCPGLLVTPHVAGSTPDFLERGLEAFLDNIERVTRGEAPSNEVSRVHGY